MKRIILSLYIFSILIAQNEVAENAADTTNTVVDTTGLNEQSSINIDEDMNLDLGLDFGYKGYKWGSSISTLPGLDNFTDAQTSADQKSAKLFGALGLDTVVVNYVYSDSGFWKVEIDYELNNNDIDDQIDKFIRLEKNISEVYGNPFSTEQTVNGPSSSYSNILHIKYSRSFYRSSWNISPARILLILNGIIQQPQTENSILEGELSILKLVYYNPDYMQSARDQVENQVLPSIYDIY